MQSVHTNYYFKKHFLEIAQLHAKLPAMDQTRNLKGLIKLTKNINPLYCKRHY